MLCHAVVNDFQPRLSVLVKIVRGLHDHRVKNIGLVYHIAGLVEDVDVLRNIKHVVLFENRKCYSARNEDLPKAIRPFVTTDIPVWRQLFP